MSTATELVVEEARRGDARLIGITGGVAVGKSTLAAAVAAALDAALVSTDGFLVPNAVLAARGLGHRKGFVESFDTAALQAFLAAWLANGTAAAPVYSHLHYDVLDSVTTVTGRRLVVEGLHLGHPVVGVREHFDLLVHLDAAPDDLERWFLARFRELRGLAATEPTAFLYAYRDMPREQLEALAVDVFRTVNLSVLDEEVRPYEAEADLLLRLGPGHEVLAVERPG